MTGPQDLPDQARLHQCPVIMPPGEQCPAMISAGYLMDGRHWRLVTRALQHDVYRTWARDTIPDLPAYLAARKAAIEDAEDKLFRAAGQPVRHRH